LALGRAVVLGIAFADCKDAPPGRRSPPPAIVEKPLFWLRDTEVLDKPSGQSVGKVVDPVLVELTGDGRVRFTAPSAMTPAWHPDDEERWFTNRQACLTAAERVTLDMRREPEAHPPGGIHIDCLGEP
jgi:hypothetical protein